MEQWPAYLHLAPIKVVIFCYQSITSKNSSILLTFRPSMSSLNSVNLMLISKVFFFISYLFLTSFSYTRIVFSIKSSIYADKKRENQQPPVDGRHFILIKLKATRFGQQMTGLETKKIQIKPINQELYKPRPKSKRGGMPKHVNNESEIHLTKSLQGRKQQHFLTQRLQGREQQHFLTQRF